MSAPDEIQHQIDCLQQQLDALKAQAAASAPPLPPLKHGDVWRRADGEWVMLWRNPSNGVLRGGHKGSGSIVLYSNELDHTGDEGPDYALVEHIASINELVQCWKERAGEAE